MRQGTVSAVLATMAPVRRVPPSARELTIVQPVIRTGVERW